MSEGPRRDRVARERVTGIVMPIHNSLLRSLSLALLIIRRCFGRIALSFAQQSLFVLLILFFLAPCALPFVVQRDRYDNSA